MMMIGGFLFPTMCLLVISLPEISSECCSWHSPSKIFHSFVSASGNPFRVDWCQGVGDCNVFCCKCQGSCANDSAVGDKRANTLNDSTETSVMANATEAIFGEGNDIVANLTEDDEGQDFVELTTDEMPTDEGMNSTSVTVAADASDNENNDGITTESDSGESTTTTSMPESSESSELPETFESTPEPADAFDVNANPTTSESPSPETTTEGGVLPVLFGCEELFKEADTNKDGSLSRDEFKNLLTLLTEHSSPEVAQVMEKTLFEIADLNGDGKLDNCQSGEFSFLFDYARKHKLNFGN